jgi:hypothetical protein
VLKYSFTGAWEAHLRYDSFLNFFVPAHFSGASRSFYIKKIRIIARPRLRNHPLLKYRRVRNWPPVWTRGTEGIVKTVKGEVGVLKEAYYDVGTSTKCFLIIDYQSQSYMGCITCPTRYFCTQLTHFLRDHIGRSIEDIGDLDISYTFSPPSHFNEKPIERHEDSSFSSHL